MRKMIRSVCFFWSERSVPPGKSREPISELQPKYPLQIFHVNLKKDAFLENLKKWKTLVVADSMYPYFVRHGLFCTILDLWNSKISLPYYAISKPSILTILNAWNSCIFCTEEAYRMRSFEEGALFCPFLSWNKLIDRS